MLKASGVCHPEVHVVLVCINDAITADGTYQAISKESAVVVTDGRRKALPTKVGTADEQAVQEHAPAE